MLLSLVFIPHHRPQAACQNFTVQVPLHYFRHVVLLLAAIITQLSLASLLLYSQENAPKPDSKTSPESEERLRSLRTRSLQNDVATASYFELQEFASELGISPNGEIGSLRNAIYNKLGIPAPRQASTKEVGDLVIRIESAQKAQTFTVERQEEDSEDYFKVSGGVRIYIRDEKEGLEHSVSADSITFNRKSNTIRAEGQVTYIKKQLESTEDKIAEKFTGDSLVFRLRVWRGVVFYGIFSRQQTTKNQRPIDAHPSTSNPEKTESDPSSNTDESSLLGRTVLSQNNITYFFDGEKIRKGSDEVLVLEKGVISTSDEEQTEYFRLGFHRLWIFGKPEWAMLSATLYVGHIPVLYLPYYYHNDSQLLFHPVFGIREAYGEFLQTTTYLFGKPKAQSTDSLSFLPISSGSKSNNEFELDALFLVPSTKAKDTQKKKGQLSADSYLKFLLDYYSYIGLFTGFDGKFKNLGPIASLNLNASLAYAYALEERVGPGYATGKPYILGSDGRYRLQLISSNFLGQSIPFRYGIDTSLRSPNNVFSLDFEYYSDPFYRRDYFNRKEDFDWIGYGLERFQRNDQDNLLEEWRKKAAEISSYKWEAGLKLNLNFQTSLISSLSFRSYISAYFKKKNDTQREFYDPTREFFYPTKFYLPDTSLRISGTLWPPLPQSSATKQPNRNNNPLLEDWKYAAKEAEATAETNLTDRAVPPPATGSSVKYPNELAKINIEEQSEIFSFRTTYDLSLQNLLQSQVDSNSWKRVEDIQLNNKELHWNGKESAQLVTEWKFLDTFFIVSLKHNVNFNLSQYFDIAENTKSSNDLTSTKQANSWDWNEESTMTLKPLYLFDWFANSTIRHNIRATIYSHKYDRITDDYQASFLDLTESNEKLRKRIRTHSLATLLDFQPIKNAYNPINNLQASISMTNELAPSIPKNVFKPRLFFEMFHWSHDVSIEFQQSGEDDPAFYAQPLNYTSIYKPLDKLEFKNVFIYNFESKEKNKEPHVDREELSFKAWWFDGGLYLRYSQPYEFDKVNLTWKAKGEPDLILDRVQLNFQLRTKDYYFWKNRILFYFTFKSSWNQDLIRYNRTSSLTAELNFSFFIYEFLNFQISYRMSNEKLYLYYPGMKDFLGYSHDRYILEDLWNSVSFWDKEKQKKGLFKMKDIRILAIHHLKDWDFIFEFVGKPKLVDNDLIWDYALGFYLRWIPIPLLKRRTTYENERLLTNAR